jgi:hypothetical protein
MKQKMTFRELGVKWGCGRGRIAAAGAAPRSSAISPARASIPKPLAEVRKSSRRDKIAGRRPGHEDELGTNGNIEAASAHQERIENSNESLFSISPLLALQSSEASQPYFFRLFRGWKSSFDRRKKTEPRNRRKTRKQNSAGNRIRLIRVILRIRKSF